MLIRIATKVTDQGVTGGNGIALPFHAFSVTPPCYFSKNGLFSHVVCRKFGKVTEIALPFDLCYLFRYPLKPLKIKNLNDRVTKVTQKTHSYIRKKMKIYIYRELTFCVTSLLSLPLTSISSPKETGRTAHDAFLGCAVNVPEACGEAVKCFQEIGEAPF